MTRPTACSPSIAARAAAHARSSFLGCHALDVSRQLQHGVLRGVEDQRARAQMLGPEVLDRRDPVAGAIADDLVAHGRHEAREQRGREALRVGRQWFPSTTPISSQ